jgi:release factor glutamine methyltransferase
VTVLEVIQRSADFLGKKGVDSPRLQTELLLGHVLKIPRMQLYLNFERKLTEIELDGFRELIKRRGQREPLQQIVGSTSFCGYEIAVSPHVLVPRPETEILAECGWSYLEKIREEQPGPIHVLDFGTGSGCLAIALASKLRDAEVCATDISAEALHLARQNALRNGVQIQFFEGEGFRAIPSNARFDLIISNPPYIPADQIESLQPEVRDFEPRGALEGGEDGLNFYRLMASEAVGFLKPGAKIMLEFGDGQEISIQNIFETQKWVVEAIREDYTRQPRILIARRE